MCVCKSPLCASVPVNIPGLQRGGNIFHRLSETAHNLAFFSADKQPKNIFRSDKYNQLSWPVLLTQYLILYQRSTNILVINFLDRSFSDWICQLKQTMFGPEDTSGKSKQPFHCLLLEYSQTKLTIYNVQCMAKFERRITITIGVYPTLRGLGWSLKFLVVLTKKRCKNLFLT